MKSPRDKIFSSSLRLLNESQYPETEINHIKSDFSLILKAFFRF